MSKRHFELNERFRTVIIFIGSVVLVGLVQIYEVNGVHRGKEVIKGTWPFTAVLSVRGENATLCGGTVISQKHILTAAHCIREKDSRAILSHDSVVAHYGIYNYSATMMESEAVASNVSEIFIHPDWDAFSIDYDGDIAILVLSDDIHFNTHIRPVFIPTVFNNDTDMSGTVVGWGETENGTYEATPRQVAVKVVSNEDCHRNDSFMAIISSERQFCGVGLDGTPAFGDSGGGLFVQHSDYNWIQYGIFSALRVTKTGQIIPDSMVLFTNVSAHKNWILQKVTETGGIINDVIHFS